MFDNNSGLFQGLSRRYAALTTILLHSVTFARRGGDRPIPIFRKAFVGYGLVFGLGWAGVLGGCTDPSQPQARTWETYQNPRYPFEFVHPNDWKAVPLSDNREGQVFQDPWQPRVSISGWASQRSAVPSPVQAIPEGVPNFTPNFTTEQGVEGILRVDIGREMSRMELIVLQEGVIYHWEGRSPTELFDEHYRFFDYIARRYRITPQVPQPQEATP